MKIKYISKEIKDLISNALQDFLDLVVEDKWQEKLYDIAKNAVNNKEYREKYAKAYSKLDNMDDKSKFTTKDMDISLIVAVTYYCNKFVKINTKTKSSIYALSGDRNNDGHFTGNESPKELYEYGLVSLHNLKDFVDIVDCYELSIPESQRKDFQKKYLLLIDIWKKALNEEHTKTIQKENIQKDIQIILDSNDRFHTWATISESYTRNWKPPMGKDDYFIFITEAAKAGIEQAYPLAAEYYYRIAKDYDMAEKYLSFLYLNIKDKHYDAKLMLFLANIYLNKLSINKGDDTKIVKMLTEDGFCIKKSDDNTEYILISKK